MRIICYRVTDAGQRYMLHSSPKSRKDGLTDAELAELRELVKEMQHG
ncbi:MAG: hypothetical protein FWH34_02755 [Desulfovibrionaceae bacterium]|nr:hypothetical protein [Desulfovibrionaceae bacterium]